MRTQNKKISKEQLEEALINALTSQEVCLKLGINQNQLKYNLKKYNIQYTFPLSSSAKNEIGNKYGKLTVIAYAGSKGKQGLNWVCKCECGNQVIRNGISLRQYNKNNHTSMCDECAKK